MATKEALLTLLIIFVLTFSIGMVMEFGIGKPHPEVTGGATFEVGNFTGAIANETHEISANKVPVIIMYENKQALDSALMEASQASTEVAALTGTAQAEPVDVKYEYETSPAVAADVTPEQLEALQKNPDVQVYEDKQFQISLSQSAPFLNATKVWPIQIAGNNITGQGQTVCIVDTGINDSHPAFAGRILAEFDFCADNSNCATNDTVAEDMNGHGTHVAGIVASNDATYRGIAPGANLVITKAANSGGTLYISTITAAIEKCVAVKDQYDISVISMSFGDGGQYETCPIGSYPTIDAALEAAYNAGIFVVAASGNSGYSSGINYPACHSKVIAVGSVDRAADSIQSYSNSGSLLDLLAPGGSSGNQITSTSNDGVGFANKYGTSMATPHVAGVAALVLQYNKLRNGVTLTPAQLENKLKDTGKNVTDSRNNLTRARVDVAAAITPAITLESPLNRAYLNGNLDFNITVDSRITSATVTINGTTYNLANDSASHWYNTTIPALQVGNYSAVFNVISDFNNSKTVDFSVLSSATAPIITLESPANGSSINRGGLLNFTITDAFGIDTVLVRYNGINSTLASPYDYNTSNWPKGLQGITVFANNTLGLSTSSYFEFTINNSAPIFKSGQPSANYTVLVAHPLSITANATDPDNDPISYSVATNVPSNYSTQVSGSIMTWSWTPASTEGGNYYVQFNATDNVTSTSANTNITVRSNTAPALSAVSGQTATAGTSKTIYFYASDADLSYGDSLSWSDDTSVFNVVPYNTTTAVATFTPTSSQVGTFDVTVTVTDSVGAKATRVFGLTVESGTTGGSGGSSGESEIIYDNEKTFDTLLPNKPASFAPHVTGLNVGNIILETNALLQGVTLKIRSMPSAGTPATDPVLQYFEIVADNLSNYNINSVTIQFEVPTTWLEQNNIDKSNVYLGQFYDSKWVKLPAVITGEDSLAVKYNATTAHLSTFAIAAEKPVEAVLEPLAAPAPSDAAARNFTATSAATGTKQSIAGESQVAIVITIIMSVLAVLALAFYLLPKKPSKKQAKSTKEIPDFGFNV